jgi:hypothetical protein
MKKKTFKFQHSKLTCTRTRGSAGRPLVALPDVAARAVREGRATEGVGRWRRRCDAEEARPGGAAVRGAARVRRRGTRPWGAGVDLMKQFRPEFAD